MTETDSIKRSGAQASASAGIAPVISVQSNGSGTVNPARGNKEALGSSEVTAQAQTDSSAVRRTTPTHRAPWHEPLPAHTEIELKLFIDPERLADFHAAPVITDNARSKGSRRHFKTIYYDTPERALRHEGISLRVRQSGTRLTQTVKSETGDDPLSRGEWEAAVPSMAPVLSLAAPFLPAKLLSELEHRPLEPVFLSDIHRHQRLIDLPSGTVEVAFDHGVLKAGERTVPVSEIELELKAGTASAIYELALRLAEHGPVRPSILAKSERGYGLAEGRPVTAPKPRKLRLDGSLPLDDALAGILRACLEHLLESLPSAEDGRDPEGVHQLRVALRRLRTALHLMRSVGSLNKLETLRSEAKWLASSLTAAREWDIFRSQTLPRVAEGCPSVHGFDALDEVAERRRMAAYHKVRAVLADRRCASFVLDLGAWIEARGWRTDISSESLSELTSPAIAFARRTLAAQHAKVLKRGRHLKKMDPAERHRLRLAVKALRYGADFLLPLCGEGRSVKRFRERLGDLQEELGSYNDMATTAALLSGLGMETTDTQIAAAAIAGWQASSMMSAESRLRSAWRDFTRTATPWEEKPAA